MAPGLLIPDPMRDAEAGERDGQRAAVVACAYEDGEYLTVQMMKLVQADAHASS